MQLADFQKIKAELTSDPNKVGYASMTNAQRAAALSNTSPVQGAIPITAVLIWGAKTGTMAKLQAHAAAATDTLQSAALALLAAINGGTQRLDVTNADVNALIGAFQAAGDFTAAAQQVLYSFGQVATPRWQVLGINEMPQEGDVGYALSLL